MTAGPDATRPNEELTELPNLVHEGSNRKERDEEISTPRTPRLPRESSKQEKQDHETSGHAMGTYTVWPARSACVETGESWLQRRWLPWQRPPDDDCFAGRNGSTHTGACGYSCRRQGT